MTYTDPMPKIKNRPSFCFNGICKGNNMRTGKTNNMTSDQILHAAVAIYNAVVLTQCPSVCGNITSKLFRIGVHAKMRAKKMPVVYPLMISIVVNTP